MQENSKFFFFQAEDGIRDKLVTGVQTCALPILADAALERVGRALDQEVRGRRRQDVVAVQRQPTLRSEERRVGKSVDLGGRRIIKKKKKERKRGSNYAHSFRRRR